MGVPGSWVHPRPDRGGHLTVRRSPGRVKAEVQVMWRNTTGMLGCYPPTDDQVESMLASSIVRRQPPRPRRGDSEDCGTRSCRCSRSGAWGSRTSPAWLATAEHTSPSWCSATSSVGRCATGLRQLMCDTPKTHDPPTRGRASFRRDRPTAKAGGGPSRTSGCRDPRTLLPMCGQDHSDELWPGVAGRIRLEGVAIARVASPESTLLGAASSGQPPVR